MKNIYKTIFGIALSTYLAGCIPQQEVRKDAPITQQNIQTSRNQYAVLDDIIAQGRENVILKDFSNKVLGSPLNGGSVDVYSSDNTSLIHEAYTGSINFSGFAEGHYKIYYTDSDGKKHKTKFQLDRKLR